jgi:hypothetical protein
VKTHERIRGYEEVEMDRQPVTSSSVAEIGYDVNTMTLEVAFRNGTTYQYFDVPESLYQELMSSESVGRFLNEQIKNSYRYTKV